ncbi:hypothetical protein [Aquibacillus sediminis]|uniref:hypothetical protein n=1 Tax=Aquibacillus sediminis TaxID=2574734 RepID=UPI001FE4E3AD|nr:hypothetical protein [Aquibacillus sediminis]
MQNRFCKYIFSIIILFSLLNSNNYVLKAEEKPPKSVCIEEAKKRWEKLNEKVLEDIVKSFNFDLSGYEEIKDDDLDLKEGDTLSGSYDKITLQHLFVGSSTGDMRLFLKNGLKGDKGYFLYKRTDGNNVKKAISKMGDIWVVMHVEEVNAKKIKSEPFNWNKCKSK